MLAKASVAKAEGEAQSTVVRAKAQAEANRMLQASFSQQLIQAKSIEKWNGILPQVSGGATPFIDLRAFKSNDKSSLGYVSPKQFEANHGAIAS